MNSTATLTAFVGKKLLASGSIEQILREVKPRFDEDPGASLLIFEDETGRQVDFDLRGTVAEVVVRAMPTAQRSGPGRPKLGVVAREISLLPRHWEWLERQPSGASAAIRKLVDEARAKNEAGDRERLAIEATSRFLTAMAGNFPGYEEATRALFARDWLRLGEIISGWPEDVANYVQRLRNASAS